MRRLLLLAAAVLCGLLVHIAIFTLVVRKPLTQSVVGDYVARKQAILAATPGPRIVILAGSNGRFSHSCAVIARETGIGCVNLSIAATLGLDFQIDTYIDALRPGDLVYLPLEYRDARAYDPDFVGDERFFLTAADPARMVSLYPPRGVLKAFLGFDVRYLISAISEMALARTGFERRFGLETMNAAGDETDHSAARARSYRDVVAAMPAPAADGAAQQAPLYWADVSHTVARLRGRGILVAGGLPTTVADTRLSPATIGFLRGVYEGAGGCFVVLPGRSLYPRAMFYDAVFHLNETGQGIHSRALAPALARIVRARRCVH